MQMFVAECKKMQFPTSMGFSLYIVIPVKHRNLECLKEGDSVKVALRKIEFTDVIDEQAKDVI